MSRTFYIWEMMFTPYISVDQSLLRSSLMETIVHTVKQKQSHIQGER